MRGRTPSRNLWGLPPEVAQQTRPSVSLARTCRLSRAFFRRLAHVSFLALFQTLPKSPAGSPGLFETEETVGQIFLRLLFLRSFKVGGGRGGRSVLDTRPLVDAFHRFGNGLLQNILYDFLGISARSWSMYSSTVGMALYGYKVTGIHTLSFFSNKTLLSVIQILSMH